MACTCSLSRFHNFHTHAHTHFLPTFYACLFFTGSGFFYASPTRLHAGRGWELKWKNTAGDDKRRRRLHRAHTRTTHSHSTAPACTHVHRTHTHARTPSTSLKDENSAERREERSARPSVHPPGCLNCVSNPLPHQCNPPTL